jgi:hypothetical protein
MSENEGKAYNKNKEYNCMLQKFTKESFCVLSHTLSLIILISVTIRFFIEVTVPTMNVSFRCINFASVSTIYDQILERLAL